MGLLGGIWKAEPLLELPRAEATRAPGPCGWGSHGPRGLSHEGWASSWSLGSRVAGPGPPATLSAPKPEPQHPADHPPIRASHSPGLCTPSKPSPRLPLQSPPPPPPFLQPPQPGLTLQGGGSCPLSCPVRFLVCRTLSPRRWPRVPPVPAAPPREPRGPEEVGRLLSRLLPPDPRDPPSRAARGRFLLSPAG